MKQTLIQNDCSVKKKWLGSYTYQVICDGITYHILVLPTHAQQLVTINSKSIWNIKTGRIDGARFAVSHVKSIHIDDFLRLENPIIVFKKMPYKVLKYINESDVVEITSTLDAYGLPIFSTTEAVVAYMKQRNTNI